MKYLFQITFPASTPYSRAPVRPIYVVQYRGYGTRKPNGIKVPIHLPSSVVGGQVCCGNSDQNQLWDLCNKKFQLKGQMPIPIKTNGKFFYWLHTSVFKAHKRLPFPTKVLESNKFSNTQLVPAWCKKSTYRNHQGNKALSIKAAVILTILSDPLLLRQVPSSLQFQPLDSLPVLLSVLTILFLCAHIAIKNTSFSLAYSSLLRCYLLLICSSCERLEISKL